MPHLQIAGDERAFLDGMPACLVSIYIIKIHLGRYDLLRRTGFWNVFKLNERALVGKIRKFRHHKVR